MNITESSRLTLRPIESLRTCTISPKHPSTRGLPSCPRPHGDLGRYNVAVGTLPETVVLPFLERLSHLAMQTATPAVAMDPRGSFASEPLIQVGNTRPSVVVRTLNALVRTGVATSPIAPREPADMTAGLLSAADAAGIVGVTDRTVRRWINSGRLPHSVVDGQFMVSRSDLDDAAAKPSATRSKTLIELTTEVAQLRATVTRLEQKAGA